MAIELLWDNVKLAETVSAVPVDARHRHGASPRPGAALSCPPIFVAFGGNWLSLHVKPLAIHTRPVHFHDWCHFGLGAFNTCAGVLGA